MKSRALVLAAVFALASARAGAADVPSLAVQARVSLERATAYLRSISTEGGYLWRYSPDLSERAGEVKATATQVWIQPPGTPAVGAAFLQAFEAMKDPRYLEAARAAADALAKGQLESGGWDYLIEFDAEKSRAWFRRSDIGKVSEADAVRRKNISTYDDDNSQSALRFLLAFCNAVKTSTDPRDREIRGALDHGLKKLLEAQYPNGAWPQRFDGKQIKPGDYPILKASIPKEYPREYAKENYFRHYTLNDNTQRDCIRTALDAFHRTGKREFLEAAKRGGEFLILAQLPEPQPVWAQQYNAKMEPAWARAFEPPAACGNESIGAMRTLVEVYLETGDRKFLAPIPSALEWFKRSEIAPNIWARYYELTTNRQIFGDRDGKIYYRIEDISSERRSGYSWRGEYGVGSFRNYYENVLRVGRDEWNERRTPKPRIARRAAEHAQSLEPRVKAILASQDNEGRWITRRRGSRAEFTSTEVVETSQFIANMAVLSEFLEVSR